MTLTIVERWTRILDEPINGLDPIGIAEVRSFIRELCDAQGKTILISSHILSEIALLADDIGIIDKGRLLEEESLEELEAKAGELMETIQRQMLERARAHRDNNTYKAVDMTEFERIFNEKTGFVKAMWCGDQACEEQIKEKLAVTSRCMPFRQEHIADTCVCCGRPAKKMVYWGRAY